MGGPATTLQLLVASGTTFVEVMVTTAVGLTTGMLADDGVRALIAAVVDRLHGRTPTPVEIPVDPAPLPTST